MRLIDRFLAKVSPEPNTGCWLWTGSVSSKGYARIWVGGKLALAHRVASMAAGHNLFEGCEVDHKCAVKCCVNPDHLEPVTRQENNRRYRASAGIIDVCARGHPMFGANLKLRADGRRQCRSCMNAAKRARRVRLGC